MSVNKYLPHVLVFPEDDANRQIANGFFSYSNIKDHYHINRALGGWQDTIDHFANSEINNMNKYQERIAVLLIDFDNAPIGSSSCHYAYAQKKIPSNLNNRVFVIGVFSEPEKLRSSLGKSYEWIGEQLAEDCYNNSHSLWQNPLLSHNLPELQRMATAKQIIF